MLYAGDEIGLHDVPVPVAARRDRGSRPDGHGRDDGRTPMIWSHGPGRGFTDEGVEPWLPFGEGHPSVEEQREDPSSVLAWCRRLIGFRKSRPELLAGGQVLVEASQGVLAWRRGTGMVVAANLTDAAVSAGLGLGVVVLATEPTLEGRTTDTVELEPWGCVVLVDPDTDPGVTLS